ncbi:hypothetical protein CK203_031096 [Vitis vinifera]|uniref:Uncharacterized protein n=1 Tax=Vitis vinifera TaxID=29760 RepID=A0A438J0N0_VITVI|nr:hypothetical protein CK203_031096 [Vitis vinifera]
MELGYKVKLRLEKIQRDFLRGGGTLEKKPHLALLGKWSCRYVVDGKVFWKQIIEGKYGKEGAGWHSCEVRGGYGVDVWNAIRKGWDLFFTRTSFEVGGLGGGFVGRLRRDGTLDFVPSLGILMIGSWTLLRPFSPYCEQRRLEEDTDKLGRNEDHLVFFEECSLFCGRSGSEFVFNNKIEERNCILWPGTGARVDGAGTLSSGKGK